MSTALEWALAAMLRVAFHIDAGPVLVFSLEANPDPDRSSKIDAVSGQSVIYLP